MKQKIKYSILAIVILGFLLTFAFFSRTSSSSTLSDLSNGGAWLLPLVIISSLLDSINPCAFSILLLTIAFLFSLGKLRSSILWIGGAYILGIFVIYLLIGLGILQTLQLFNTPNFMAKVGALLLVLLGGINIINEFFPKFPIKLKIPHAAHQKIAELMEKASLPTAFLLGAFVGLCEFPCTGGPYLMILGLLHDSQTYLSGLWYLVLYNLVFVLPLVIILLIASDKRLLDAVQVWQQTERKSMRLWGGVIMVALGALIFIL